MRTDVAIVGGGLAGLACAVALRGSGLRVDVFEREDWLGGRAASWRDARTGDMVDIGPHVLLNVYDNMLALLGMLGTRDGIAWHTEDLLTLLDHGRRIVMRNPPLPAPLPVVPSLLAVPGLSLGDKLSSWGVVRRALSMPETGVLEHDGEDARDFLVRHGVTARFIDWFWASACMTVLNTPLERCSAGALLRLCKHLLGHTRLHMGVATCGLAELYVPGALRLIEECGGRVWRGAKVQALLVDAGSARGLQLAGGERIEARTCVVALPPHEASTLLAPHVAEADAWRAFEPSPYVSTFIWFDRKLTREQFWSRVWSAADLTSDSYDLSNIRAGWADRPSVIASNIIYSHRATSLEDDAILERVTREIAEALPDAATSRILHARVHRIPMGIICPTPGSERVRPRTRTEVRGLYIAGDWTQTALPSSMESAVRSAFLAAEHIWADARAPRALARPAPERDGLVRFAERLSVRRRARRADEPGKPTDEAQGHELLGTRPLQDAAIHGRDSYRGHDEP